MSEGDIIVRAALMSFEWVCQSCGDSGAGMMPEDHASGACEATRTIVPPAGYVDGGGI